MRPHIQVFLFGLALPGCDVGPPLESLPLRDALGADPTTIRKLSPDTRRALAARFESERRRRAESEVVALAAVARDALGQVRALDQVLDARGRDALLVVELAHQGAGATVYPVPDAIAVPDGPPLPPLLDGNGDDDETRSLDGPAGDALRALVTSSGAQRMQRVTRWPVAAVALGDTIYVNAAWLVALAPILDGDAGVSATVPVAGTSVTSRRVPATRRVAPPLPSPGGGAGDEAPTTHPSLTPQSDPYSPDLAGTPPPPPAPDWTSGCADACVGCSEGCGSVACSSSDSSSGCDESGDEDLRRRDSCDCSSSDSDCSSSSGEGCGGEDCSSSSASATPRRRLGPARPVTSRLMVVFSPARPTRPEKARASRVPQSRLGWLCAPLAYLLMARRRRGGGSPP